MFSRLSALVPRGAFGCYVLLFAILFGAGVVLTIFGFDLGEVDMWIEAHGGWFESVGHALFRIACGLVMLVCALAIWSAIFERANPDRPGIGCAILAIVVAWFAWFGVIG